MESHPILKQSEPQHDWRHHVCAVHRPHSTHAGRLVMTIYEALMTWLIINELFVIYRGEVYIRQVKS
jgi:hypothetical protein